MKKIASLFFMFRNTNIERTKLVIMVVWYLWIPNKNNKKNINIHKRWTPKCFKEVELLEKDVQDNIPSV